MRAIVPHFGRGRQYYEGMKRFLGYLAALLVAFGTVHFVEKSERNSALHAKCVESNKNRALINNATNHLKLTEDLIINSNIKAQKTIPSYQYPQELLALQALPQIQPLPYSKC